MKFAKTFAATLAAGLFQTAQAATPVVDFELQDVNAGSKRNGQNVSPRQYQGRVSAWYFIGSH